MWPITTLSKLKQHFRFFSKYAVTCPGQGLYRNGVLELVKTQKPLFQRYLDELDAALNCKFSDKLFANSSETEAKQWLNKTSNAQPAILASTCILSNLVETEHQISIINNASYLLGHSLGEYTALVLSGIIDFTTGIKVVRRRGQLMEDLCLGQNYGMIALLIKPKFAKEVIELAQEHNVLGNINSNYQIVISGEITKLKEFIDILRKIQKMALIKAVQLPVSIPFHSEILKPVVPELKLLLDGALNDQNIPIISNLNGQVSYEKESTIRNILDANYQPVQWQKSIAYLENSPVSTIFNLGPGEALHGINKKYNVKSVSLDDVKSLDKNSEFMELKQQLKQN